MSNIPNLKLDTSNVEQMDKVGIIEIFSSLEGECFNIGLPTIFVRLAWCDVKCSICDTKYSWGTTLFWTEDEIAESIIKILMNSNVRRISFTGGNPLLQINSILCIINKIKASNLPFIKQVQFNLEHPGYYNHSNTYNKTLKELEVFDTITMDVKLFFGTSVVKKQNLLYDHITMAVANKNIILKVMVSENEDLEAVTCIDDICSKIEFENYYAELPKYLAVIRNQDNEIDKTFLKKTTETLRYLSNFKLNYPMHVALNFR